MAHDGGSVFEQAKEAGLANPALCSVSYDDRVAVTGAHLLELSGLGHLATTLSDPVVRAAGVLVESIASFPRL